MAKIILFLASSSELKDDREQFEIFINRKNIEWNKNDVFVELNIWEDFIDAISQSRLQNEYNMAIKECDIFIMLFFTKVGKFTEEEFSIALKQFKETNKPLIFTYQKFGTINMSEINDGIISVFQFKKRLENLGHFCSSYKSIDDLKLQVTTQITKLLPSIFIKEPEDIKTQKEYPRELTPIPKIEICDIVGREKELLELHDKLFNHKKIVVINGMGGIGKTMLVQAYLSEYYDSYKHFVWVSQTGDHAARAFLENKDLLDNLQIDLLKIEEKDRLRTVLNKQRSIEAKPNLLIIDNADKTICDFYQLLPGYPNWHVLITSREKLEQFEILELNFLNHNQATMLFKKHCSRIDDDCQISHLLKTVEYHTLTIEILAKTAQLQRTPFDKLAKAIKEDLKAHITIQGGLSKVGNITSYLKSIFNFSPLSKQQQWLMKQFCFLPPDFHSYDLLFDVLQIDTLSWAEDFSEALEDLCAKGWLLKNADTDSFKMHRLIAEVTIDKLKPQYDEIKILIQKVAECIFFEEDVDDFLPRIKWIPYGNTILELVQSNEEFKLNVTEPEVCSLQKNLGWIYRELTEYPKAEILLDNALTSAIEKMGLKNVFVTDCQSKLGDILNCSGKYDRAYELLEQAVNTDIEILDENNPLVALHRNNLALVYNSMSRNEEARNILEQALQSDLDNFGEKHSIVAIRRHNLGNILNDLGEYEKAQEVYEKALQSLLIIRGEKHPSVANTQLLSSYVYFNQGNIQKAEELCQSAYNIDLNIFGPEHSRTKQSKNGLADAIRRKALAQYQEGKFDDAIASLDQVVELNYEIPSAMCHLARIYFTLGRISEAKECIIQAYEQRRDAQQYVLVRILYLKLIIAMIDDNNIKPELTQLKHELVKDNASTTWIIQPMLEKVQFKISTSHFALLKALSAAIDTSVDIIKLDDIEEWKNIEKVD